MKKPAIRTSVQVVRQFFELNDATDGLSLRALERLTGRPAISFSRWRSGKASPNTQDFEDALQTLGYKLTIERIEPK